MKVELPYPDKAVWPNGRPHYMARHRANKAHRSQAYYAVLEQIRNGGSEVTQPIKIALTVHPKPKGPHPDKDNCVAAAKAFIDGIADALEINDRDFEAPTVTFGERSKYGSFVVTL